MLHIKNRNLRGGSLGCASTILAYVARLLVAVAFLTAFVPSFALAQDAADAQASETGTDVASSDGQAGSIDAAATATATATGALGRATATASAESGVVPGPCEGGVSANCGEIVVEGVTYACHNDGNVAADELVDTLNRQFAHFRRVFRREIAAIHRELNQLHGEMAAEQAFDQRFYGWSPTSTYQQRLVIARETGRYLREVVPVLFMENEITDDEDRAEFEAAQRARAEFERRTNDRMTEFERQLGELRAGQAATNTQITQINRRLDRHTLGFAAVAEAELLGGHGMYGGTVRVMWRTGGFAASAQGGGFWNSTLGAGTFVAGADAGAAIDVGDIMRVDLGAYARTMQLPEDQLGERSGRIVRSAGSLFFEAGAFGRWFSNRRGASVLVEARLGLADPPGDSDVGVVAAIAVGAAANLGL